MENTELNVYKTEIKKWCINYKHTHKEIVNANSIIKIYQLLILDQNTNVIPTNDIECFYFGKYYQNQQNIIEMLKYQSRLCTSNE